jgi:hypothetical protein
MMSSRHGLYGLGYTRATLLLLQRVTIKQLMSISFKKLVLVLILYNLKITVVRINL